MSAEAEAYNRIHAILDKARALSGQELEQHLEESCGSDLELRAAVLELLAAGSEEQASDFFADENAGDLHRVLAGAQEEELANWLPEKIGAYTILRQIGRGGMGVVYEAEQESPRRKVAIKLLQSMHATPESLRRFRREAQLLGRLQHPGIAQIIEASTYDLGSGSQPFFAMELVDGLPLTDYAEANALDVHARLALVAQLCDALEYAHAKGVVHRDLKPANILVTTKESSGRFRAVDTRDAPRARLKILDFGIARAIDSDLTAATLQTSEGQLVGTISYMSPEQASGDPDAIGGRSDVYAVGVLAYELLAGHLPLSTRDKLLHEAVRVVREDEPSALGTLDRALRGDVETIVAKALAKEKERRYPSAAEMAADIRRYLSDQPIEARPPSTIYQLQKFTRRNRALVGGVVATLVVALVGAVVAGRFAFEATRRAQEVERRASEVLRLSLAQDLEDLVARAGTLWPPYAALVPALEEWVRDAEELTAELPALLATRDELRARAMPRTEDELEAERKSHPEFALFELTAGKALFTRRVLLQRRDGVEAELPEVDWDTLPGEARELGELARNLVYPARTIYGQEPRGLVLAERAFELASDEVEEARIAGILAQANLCLGRDEEGMELIYFAHDLSTGRTQTDWANTIPKMEEGLAQAATEEGLAETARRLAVLEAEATELDQRISERRDWSYPEDVEATTRARWWDNQLTGLIGDLRSLNDDATGLSSERGVTREKGWSVARRLETARRLREGFAPDGELARRWDAALPKIDAAYPGLHLAPQMGLVPLGPDPQSGLWEFWHVQSGFEAERGDDGKLLPGEETGLVFVLLPGGRSWMGAQSREAEGRHYDPEASLEGERSNEGPVHEVELSPFFLAKYEMTQGQWQRTLGFNPSRWAKQGNVPGAHPVEQVTWNDCVAVLPRLGLGLPTEAQWEYACRAGTNTPRPFAFEDFAMHANVKDVSYDRFHFGPKETEPWDDGMGVHGPVGSLLPNAFGLHDMLGNVGEWCMDGFDWLFYKGGPRKDPISPGSGVVRRMIRGNSYVHSARDVRSAARPSNVATFSAEIIGLRPARGIH